MVFISPPFSLLLHERASLCPIHVSLPAVRGYLFRLPGRPSVNTPGPTGIKCPPEVCSRFSTLRETKLSGHQPVARYCLLFELVHRWLLIEIVVEHLHAYLDRCPAIQRFTQIAPSCARDHRLFLLLSLGLASVLPAHFLRSFGQRSPLAVG